MVRNDFAYTSKEPITDEENASLVLAQFRHELIALEKWCDRLAPRFLDLPGGEELMHKLQKFAGQVSTMEAYALTVEDKLNS